MKLKHLVLFALSAAMICSGGLTQALADDPADPSGLEVISLSGNTEYNYWTTPTSAQYGSIWGSYPGSSASTTTASSQFGGDAGIKKVSSGTNGGPFFSSGSIYFGGYSSVPNTYGGTISVVDETPLAGLQTVVLRLEIGEVYGYDFYNNEYPTLSITTASGTTTITLAGYSLLAQVDTGEVYAGEPVYVNTYEFVWELDELTESVSSLSVDISALEHSQIYSVSLAQSDEIQAVPEPSTYALMALGAGIVLWQLRRRRVTA